MDSTQTPPSPFDKNNLLHLLVIDKRNQKIIISIKYQDFSKNPESLAISYNPFDDQNGPLYVIPKTDFRILIEGGGWPPISIMNAILLFVQETPDSKIDEQPYRERMIIILDLMEKGRLDSDILDSIKDKILMFQEQETHWLHFHILQNLLSNMNLEWVGLLDTNPLNLLMAIWEIPNTPEKEERVRNLVFDELCAQIDRGGTTIGLDVEKMAEYEALTTRINRVRELRRMEIDGMEPIVISKTVSDDQYEITSVDVDSLWYTAYGYQVLNELNLGKSCDEEDFIDIQEELSNFGIQLHANAEPQGTYQPSMTQAMKEYIWYVSRINTEGISLSQNDALIGIIQSIMS